MHVGSVKLSRANTPIRQTLKEGNMQTYRVVKMTVKTGCDLAREVVKGNLPKVKADSLKDKLDRASEKETFDPGCIVSYICEPVN